MTSKGCNQNSFYATAISIFFRLLLLKSASYPDKGKSSLHSQCNWWPNHILKLHILTESFLCLSLLYVVNHPGMTSFFWQKPLEWCQSCLWCHSTSDLFTIISRIMQPTLAYPSCGAEMPFPKVNGSENRFLVLVSVLLNTGWPNVYQAHFWIVWLKFVLFHLPWHCVDLTFTAWCPKAERIWRGWQIGKCFSLLLPALIYHSHVWSCRVWAELDGSVI